MGRKCQLQNLLQRNDWLMPNKLDESWSVPIFIIKNWIHPEQHIDTIFPLWTYASALNKLRQSLIILNIIM